MPDYAVQTTFKAKDRVSPAFKRMGKNADKFGRRTSSAFRNASKAGYEFQTILKGIIAANLIRGGVAQVTTGLGTITDQFIRFDEVMIGATARFKDIGPLAKDFNSELKRLKTSARDLAQGTRFTTTEVGMALDSMARAGFKSTESIGTVVSMMNLAKATGEEFASATSRSVDLLGAFGLRSENLAKRIANQTRLNDVLTKATLSSNVTLEDLFETLKFIGPIATQAGMGLEEAVAMTALLGDAGLKGTVAATALKAALVNIPSKRLAAEFKANGVAVSNAEGNIRKYSDILSEIGEKTKDLGTREKSQIFERIFGLRGIAGAGTILSSLTQLGDFERALLKAGGVAKATGDRIEQSLMSRILRLGSAALEAGFKVLDAFEVNGKRGIDALTDAVSRFNVQPIVDSIRLLTTAFSAMGAVIKPILPFLPELIAGFVAYNATLKIMAIAPFIMQMYRLIKVFGLTKIAVWALNAAFAVNPIGLVALGVAALTAGIVFLERKFKIFSKTLTVFKNIFTSLFEAAKALFGLELPRLGDIGANIQRAADEAGARRERQEAAAPNEKDAQANQIRFAGRLDIFNAPEGSTFTSSTPGAPTLDVALLGVPTP